MQITLIICCLPVIQQMKNKKTKQNPKIQQTIFKADMDILWSWQVACRQRHKSVLYVFIFYIWVYFWCNTLWMWTNILWHAFTIIVVLYRVFSLCIVLSRHLKFSIFIFSLEIINIKPNLPGRHTFSLLFWLTQLQYYSSKEDTDI